MSRTRPSPRGRRRSSRRDSGPSSPTCATRLSPIAERTIGLLQGRSRSRRAALSRPLASRRAALSRPLCLHPGPIRSGQWPRSGAWGFAGGIVASPSRSSSRTLLSTSSRPSSRSEPCSWPRAATTASGRRCRSAPTCSRRESAGCVPSNGPAAPAQLRRKGRDRVRQGVVLGLLLTVVLVPLTVEVILRAESKPGATRRTR